MPGPIWKRPSAYVVVCALVVISAFVARGDLRIDPEGRARARERTARAPQVVRSNLPAPRSVSERVVLAGRVLDALGFALAGAEVFANAGRIARTGDDGTFELSVEKASFSELSIRADGYAPNRLLRSPSAPGPLVVELEPRTPWDRDAEEPTPAAAPALTGEGTVRDREGKPVAGAFVTAAGSGLWSRTDDIGRFELPLLDPQPTLVVHRPGTADGPGIAARSGPIALGRERGIVPLPEIVAAVGTMIRGTVRDADGSTLIGVPVEVVGDGVKHVCHSDAGGAFAVSGLVPGTYEVRPMAWEGNLGHAREVVAESEPVECELVCETIRTQRVQVCRAGGAPVGKAFVAVSVDGRRRAVARADESGWAELRIVTGALQFEVRAEDGMEPLEVQSLDSETGRLVVAP